MRETFALFREMRPAVKAMVYLHYTFEFVSALTGIFINIFLYQRFRSVQFSIELSTLYFLGCALGFCLVGSVIAYYRADMKWGYYAAFVAMSASYPLLFGDPGHGRALLFMFVNGIGLGLYWVTLHTFELTETKNAERDFYSSVLSAGNQAIDLIAPAIATLTFFISQDVLHAGAYTLLFIIAPLSYLLGIPHFRHIKSYRPAPIRMADLRHFISEKRNRRAQLYLFAGSLDYAVASVVLPITAIMFLSTEKQVGIFSTVVAVVSAFTVLILSRYRHTGNRMHFLFLTCLASAAVTFFLAARFDLAAFIICSLLAVIIRPLLRVSAHVIDLETMETLGREGSDFFPTMILRDAAFGFWRLVVLGIFGLFVAWYGEAEGAIRIGIILIGCAELLTYAGARYMYGK